MPTTIKPDKLPLILEYLNNPAAPGQEPPYGDGMDKILAAKTDDNGDIIAIGQDGSKILAIKIGDKATSIRMANYEEQVNQPGAEFAQYPIGQESLIAGIKQAGDEQISSWLDQVKDMLLTADDLGTAQAAIFELYPQLETAEFANQTADYLTLAGLTGYFEAENE